MDIHSADKANAISLVGRMHGRNIHALDSMCLIFSHFYDMKYAQTRMTEYNRSKASFLNRRKGLLMPENKQ